MDEVTVSCKCAKGCVNVYDLDAKSGGGWECPWCSMWIDKAVVRKALDEHNTIELSAILDAPGPHVRACNICQSSDPCTCMGDLVMD